MRFRKWSALDFPSDKTFRLRHGIAWLAYVYVVKWNLEFLAEARHDGGFSLLPAVGLAWVALITAGAFIEHWLDGANRYLLFRFLLVLSALASFVLASWMLWQYAIFLLVGVATLFRRSYQLVTLATFMEGLIAVSLGVVTFGVYAWASVRVVIVLLSGERKANFEQVLQNEPFGGERNLWLKENSLPAAPPPPRPTHVPQAASSKPPDAPVIPAETVVQPPDSGWRAVESVFRNSTDLPELARALQALPELAQQMDAKEAAAARDWISRLADHPGAYEVDIPRAEIVDPYVRTRTVRIAELALESMMRWDDERAKASA